MRVLYTSVMFPCVVPPLIDVGWIWLCELLPLIWLLLPCPLFLTIHDFDKFPNIIFDCADTHGVVDSIYDIVWVGISGYSIIGLYWKLSSFPLCLVSPQFGLLFKVLSTLDHCTTLISHPQYFASYTSFLYVVIQTCILPLVYFLWFSSSSIHPFLLHFLLHSLMSSYYPIVIPQFPYVSEAP